MSLSALEQQNFNAQADLRLPEPNVDLDPVNGERTWLLLTPEGQPFALVQNSGGLTLCAVESEHGNRGADILPANSPHG